MNESLSRLAEHVRLIVMLDAALLFLGIVLTSFNLLLIGWSIYILGHLGAILTFAAIAAFYRQRMDGWSWLGLLVLVAGLLAALPALASIWTSYQQVPTHAELLVPLQTAPIGLAAEITTWVGLAFYALAAHGTPALPRGVAWLFLLAALVGLAACLIDVWFITPVWWVLAVLLLVLAFVAVGSSFAPPEVDRAATA